MCPVCSALLPFDFYIFLSFIFIIRVFLFDFGGLLPRGLICVCFYASAVLCYLCRAIEMKKGPQILVPRREQKKKQTKNNRKTRPAVCRAYTAGRGGDAVRKVCSRSYTRHREKERDIYMQEIVCWFSPLCCLICEFFCVFGISEKVMNGRHFFTVVFFLLCSRVRFACIERSNIGGVIYSGVLGRMLRSGQM